MSSDIAVLDAALAKRGILVDANGILIGANDAEALRYILRVCEAARVPVSQNASEQIVLGPPFPADTGTA